MVDNWTKTNKNGDKRRHMRHADWRTISLFGYVFGVLFLLVGLYAYLYYETDWIGWIGLAFYPYRNYAILLLIIGIALLITGYFTKRQAKRK
jgi:uncharacterized membrane protein